MIKVENVCKKYGTQTVLNHVNLEVKRGKIVGIVGRNGSGKTVLFKSICGLIPVDEGKIIVDNQVIGQDLEIPQNIGVIIETPGFLPNYSGYKNLYYLAKIQNRIKKEDIIRTLEMVGLDSRSKKNVSKYSMGMRQRLGIAQAIMENPDILVLDEPMNGLDKEGVNEMRELFLRWKAEGKTMIIASHGAEDIDILCDDVWEMDKGIATKVR